MLCNYVSYYRCIVLCALRGDILAHINHKYDEFRNSPTLQRDIRVLRQKLYNAIDRCYNENNVHDYYGRVKVCDEWLQDNSNFIVWGLKNGYKEGLYLDRIDPFGDYEPANCRWVNKLISQKNKRNVNFLTYKNITLSHEEWCNALGYGHDTIRNRIVNLGFDEQKAIEKGVHNYSLYPHQIETLGKTYYYNRVAYYMDMGLRS